MFISCPLVSVRGIISQFDRTDEIFNGSIVQDNES